MGNRTLGKSNETPPSSKYLLSDDSGPPTLKDIAQISGLAVPTVSRALSGASDIGLKTRERVRKIADEIGYIPNRAGLRLRTGKTNVIALLLPSDLEGMNYSSEYVSSIAAGLRETQYNLILTPFFPDQDLMRPIRNIVRNRSADAIIMNQTREHDERIQYLMEQDFPFVTHGRSKWADQHPYLDFDNFEFIRLASRKLRQKGRRSLLLITPHQAQNYAQNMIEGARVAAKEQGITIEIVEEPSNQDGPLSLKSIVNETLTGQSSIDGIISCTVMTTVHLLLILSELGKNVGSDIDVCAKERFPFFSLIRPDVLTVREDLTQAGSFLAKAALHAIEHPKDPPLQLLVTPEQEDNVQINSLSPEHP